MSNPTISVDFPNDILLALNESENDLKKRIKLTLAIQWYKLKNLALEKPLNFPDCQGLNLKMNFQQTTSQFQI